MTVPGFQSRFSIHTCFYHTIIQTYTKKAVPPGYVRSFSKEWTYNAELVKFWKFLLFLYQKILEILNSPLWLYEQMNQFMNEQINQSKNPRSMIQLFDWVLISEKNFRFVKIIQEL